MTSESSALLGPPTVSYTLLSGGSSSRELPADVKTAIAAQRWIFRLQYHQDHYQNRYGFEVNYEELIRHGDNLQSVHLGSDITDKNFKAVAQAFSTSKVQHISFINSSFTGSYLNHLKSANSFYFLGCKNLEVIDLPGCSDVELLDLADCPKLYSIRLDKNCRLAQFQAIDCPHLASLFIGEAKTELVPGHVITFMKRK